MTDFLQLSEQAIDTDWTGLNYGTADIAAYSVVVATAANALSVSNVVDGIAVGLTGATGSLPAGVAMEILRGVTFTSPGAPSGITGPAGAGRIRSYGIAKVVASAGISAGQRVIIDGTGLGTVIAGFTAGSGQNAQLGVALSTAINANDEIAVLLCIANNA